MRRFLLLLTVILPFTAMAQNETDALKIKYKKNSEDLIIFEGLKYQLIKDGKGNDVAMLANGNEWIGELTIPSSINYQGKDYTVFCIQSLAFHQCQTLTRVTIPSTVQGILQNASMGMYGYSNPFLGCTALERIEVVDDNNWLCDVDGILFSKDMTRLYAYPSGATQTSYDVPEGTTRIYQSAISYNASLQKITLPLSVEKIDAGAFSDCPNLKEIILSEKLTYLSAFVFKNCKSLESVNIPTSVKETGEQIFMGCSSLTTITLPVGLTSVGSLAFQNCTSLKSAILPSTLQSVSHGMFSGCSRLVDVLIPEGVERVEASAFNDCVSLKRLDIPQSVTYIASYPFSNCAMDALIIRGKLIHPNNHLFDWLDVSTIIYTIPEQVNEFKNFYSGLVLPLSSYDTINKTTYLPADCNNSWYNLKGQQISTPINKGLFIHKGKKYLKY